MASEKKKGILGFLASLADPVESQKRLMEIQEKKDQLLQLKAARQNKPLEAKKTASPQKAVSTNQERPVPISDQPHLPEVGKKHRVAGVKYRTQNVMKLAIPNPNYKLKKPEILAQGLEDTPIHKFLFPDGPTVLEQEPDNPEDPNAIKVVVAGQHIGYIKAGSCAHVNKLINSDRIEKILCRIYGGPYKGAFYDDFQSDNPLDSDDPNYTGKIVYTMETGEDDFRAEIRIIEKASK